MSKKLKLKHMFHCIDGHWYWVCPVCGEWLCPHRMDIPSEKWKVFQAKGAASRHLMKHDPYLVQHGRKLEDALKKPKIYKNCKACGKELGEYQIYGLCSECLTHSVDEMVEQSNKSKKMFVEDRKILSDDFKDGTDVECFCRRIYHSNRNLKNGEVTICCYCGRSGYFKDGKLSVFYNDV